MKRTKYWDEIKLVNLTKRMTGQRNSSLGAVRADTLHHARNVQFKIKYVVDFFQVKF